MLLAPRHVLLFLCCFAAFGSTRAGELASHLRRPIALATSPDGRWLYAANRDSGTISIADWQSRSMAGEISVGNRLSDIQQIGNSSRYLVTDEGTHEVVLLELEGTSANVIQRTPISPHPVSILVSSDGRTATITSLWSRRLTFLAIEPQQLNVNHVLDLPFAPRTQLRLPDRNRLLIADAFGGRLALIDTQPRHIAELREIPGHNIRGLGLSPDGQMLLVSHQMLNDLAQSVRNDIHWGLLMTNDLRWLKVESLLAGGDQLYRGGHMHPLGDPGKGGADPGAIAVATDGTVVITISGVNQVAFGEEGDFAMQRLKVGRRPTAVQLSRDGRTAFIANTFDDSISILDLERRLIAGTISLGPSPDLTLAQRGELLFYDARLSHDGWMSCHSCHTDGHSNGQMSDNFSDRSFGAAKRVLSLFGVKDTLPLAWNGQVESLEQQIQNSVKGTMQRDGALSNQDVSAITAFLNTLQPPPSLNRLRGTHNEAAIGRGQKAFARYQCDSCHASPTFTSPSTYDVGLHDAQGNAEFNPPSLRGVSHRDAYFHDNRAKTLQDVFTVHSHPSDSPISTSDLSDLLSYLGSL